MDGERMFSNCLTKFSTSVKVLYREVGAILMMLGFLVSH